MKLTDQLSETKFLPTQRKENVTVSVWKDKRNESWNNTLGFEIGSSLYSNFMNLEILGA